MRWEIRPPECEATKDGHQCERDREPAHTDHSYTAWSHPNQYGSYPHHEVSWRDAEPVLTDADLLAVAPVLAALAGHDDHGQGPVKDGKVTCGCGRLLLVEPVGEVA